MNLIVTSRFDRKITKLLKNNPQLKDRISKTFKLMQSSFNHPSLRLHKLSGSEIWSVSVTMEIRIIFHRKNNNLYLLDIGSHQEVY